MGQFSLRVNRKKYESENSTITGKEILIIAGCEPVEDFELLKKINEAGFEPVQLDEVIDLKEPGIEGFKAKLFKKLTIYVDDEPLDVDEFIMTPNEIIEETGKNSEGFYLKQIDGHKEIGYKNDRDYQIRIEKGQKFITCKLAPTTVS
ncbi:MULTISPECIES: multiubiquitin domain-containing protein [Flavobacteriaceae]|uniref:Multiubiquitin domain-containing protein n=1 Tax=Galbibacter pacificus TaxID=2996052 RepID=A0ABT6FT08_9FLAO|nr:multiubiquitin domain-containing protein [Galbibacter pacificus]MDG3582479.1 multiubiquitin domain-containing protein [Galbibacter pacificus]MDG3586403.1 multiubiquitin domain-containing protein [Galbibacter pacificus]